jgi:hypothetical protein
MVHKRRTPAQKDQYEGLAVKQAEKKQCLSYENCGRSTGPESGDSPEVQAAKQRSIDKEFAQQSKNLKVNIP